MVPQGIFHFDFLIAYIFLKDYGICYPSQVKGQKGHFFQNGLNMTLFGLVEKVSVKGLQSTTDDS